MMMIGIGSKTIRNNQFNSIRFFSSSICKRNLNKSNGNKERFDIVIVGGGMVGSSFACALGSTRSTSHLKIGLIDAAPIPSILPFKKKETPPDLRVSSLNLGSIEFLKTIGAWEMIESTRTGQFFGLKVWDATGNGVVQFDSPSSEPLGHIVENNLIIASIYEKIKEMEQIKVISPSFVDKIDYQPPNLSAQFLEKTENSRNEGDWVNVTLKDGTVIQSKLVVGSDGGKSAVRSAMDVSSSGWSHNQKGVVVAVEHSSPNNIAWQRFFPDGPIALLPLFGNYSSIVWSTTPTHAETLLSLPKEELQRRINEVLKSEPLPSNFSFFHGLLKPLTNSASSYLPSKQLLDSIGRVAGLAFPNLSPSRPNPPEIINIVGKAASFPLGTSHSSEYVKPRFALIGDAAHTINPLAGQGVNLGFSDSAKLASCIVDGVESGQDLGSIFLLQNYQDQSKLSNLAMMAGVEGLKRLFDINISPINFIRNTGMRLTNALDPLKPHIVQFASSPSVDLKKLGRNSFGSKER